jgi:hypothetical protein
MKTFALILLACAIAAAAVGLFKIASIAQQALPTIAAVQTLLPKVVNDADQIASAAKTIQTAAAPIEQAGKYFQELEAKGLLPDPTAPLPDVKKPINTAKSACDKAGAACPPEVRTVLGMFH